MTVLSGALKLRSGAVRRRSELAGFGSEPPGGGSAGRLPQEDEYGTGGGVVLTERRPAGARPGEGAGGTSVGVGPERETPGMGAAVRVDDPPVVRGHPQQPLGALGGTVGVQPAQQVV